MLARLGMDMSMDMGGHVACGMVLLAKDFLWLRPMTSIS
jgi:hypothetical protein